MSEKKVVRRSVAIALGIACIILIAGIGGAVAYYTRIINDKNSTYNDYVETHSHTDTEYNSAISDYAANHHHSDSDYNSLQSNYNSLQSDYSYLKLPHLVGNLDAKDNRPWWGSPSLHVFGTVTNIGSDTAYNSLLYVAAFQGAVLAFNTTITVGTVNYGGFVYVDSSIAYVGGALTSWRIWSQPWGIDWTWYP